MQQIAEIQFHQHIQGWGGVRAECHGIWIIMGGRISISTYIHLHTLTPNPEMIADRCKGNQCPLRLRTKCSYGIRMEVFRTLARLCCVRENQLLPGLV
jgi:hypothetical protein